MATKIITKKKKKAASKVRKPRMRMIKAPLTLDYTSSGPGVKDHRETFVIPFQQLEITTANVSDSIVLETKLTPVSFGSTRMEIMSRCYEAFRMNKVSLEFRSNLAMTESGTIIMAYLADPMDGATLSTTGAMAILGNYKNVMGRVTEPLTLSLGPKDLSKSSPWYQLEPNSTDLRLSQQGKIEIGYVGSVAANRVLGTLFFRFDVSFSRPCIPITGPSGIETTETFDMGLTLTVPNLTETPIPALTAQYRGGKGFTYQVIDGITRYYIDNLKTIGRQILSSSLVLAGGMASYLLNMRGNLYGVADGLDKAGAGYSGDMCLSLFFSHVDFDGPEPDLIDPTYVITEDFGKYTAGTYTLYGHARPYLSLVVSGRTVDTYVAHFFEMMFYVLNFHDVCIIPCLWQSSGGNLYYSSSASGRGQLHFNVHENLLTKRDSPTSLKESFQAGNFVFIGPEADTKHQESKKLDVTSSSVTPSFPTLKPRMK